MTSTSSELTRRSFVATAVSMSTALVAGCLGDDDEPTPTPTPTVTPTPTPTPPGETEPLVEPDHYEETAHEFVERLAAGDYEAAEAMVADEYQDELSAATLDAAWADIEATRGSPMAVYLSVYQEHEFGLAVVLVNVSFDDGPQEVIVSLNDDQEVEGVFLPETPEWTPPAYIDQTAFSEAEVTIQTDIECTLTGVAAIPDGADGVPGVVLVHGSGPSDRDGTFGPNRTYRELAEGLATHGVATLRYDKRNYACEVDLADVTVDEVITDDAVSAIEELRAHPAVDADQIIVAGHSLGGTLAPRIANRADGIAGVAMLAPAARSMDELIVDQQEHLVELDPNLTGEEAEEYLDEVESLAEQIRELDIDDGEVVNYHGGREYYASLQDYDHFEVARSLEVPIVIQQGARDFQVTIEDDLPMWEDELAGQDLQVETYDDLNHLFQESTGQMTIEEYAEPESPVAERVIDDLVEFVEQVEG